MKKKITFCGIPILTLRQKNSGPFRVDLFCIPSLLVKNDEENIKVSLYAFSKLFSHAKKVRGKSNIFKKFKNNKKVKITFMACRPGMWEFDYLIKLLEKDGRFDCSIFIMPEQLYGPKAQDEFMKETYEQLVQKGYNPVLGVNPRKHKLVDLRKEINPDIIFYVDFWKPHIHDKYYITEYPDKVTFLCDYGFSVANDALTCTYETNRLVDRYFRPTIIHKKMAAHLMENKGENVVVTGSPKLDVRFDKDYKPQDVWKPQKDHIRKKRVIWAPHHSFDTSDGSLFWHTNAFEEIYDFMFEIAEKYKDKIQFVFRPHPILRGKLEKAWGEWATKKYYNRWNSFENTQYYDGLPMDLFATSDAMIMDCLSFMAEYTAFDKPIFYTKTSSSKVPLNEFGKELYKLFYKPTDDLKQGIIDFIENVVLKGDDPMAKPRQQFVQKYFSKIDDKTASENIYHEIVNFLEKPTK